MAEVLDIATDKTRTKQLNLWVDWSQWRLDLTPLKARIELRLTHSTLVAVGISGLAGGLLVAIVKILV